MSKTSFYVCSNCGNIVMFLEEGCGDVMCCHSPLEPVEPNTVDASQEKHIPVAELNGDEVTVKVGSLEHPMVEEHYIKWIFVISEDRIQKARLSPGQEPKARFSILGNGDLDIYEYCNIHGLWKTTVKR